MVTSLYPIANSNTYLWSDMWKHYSQPNGFVGRNICYLILNGTVRYGSIVGGSATLHLPGREKFFASKKVFPSLDEIINNTFFHIEKKDGKYPERNFVPKVLRLFRETIIRDWIIKYKDFVIGFESLVELPRNGDCYLRDGWSNVGQTKGLTCKRISGNETGRMTGKRVWDRENLKPKHVFCRLA